MGLSAAGLFKFVWYSYVKIEIETCERQYAMEGRATTKVLEYMKDFKDHIKGIVLDMDCSKDAKAAALQRIYSYGPLEFTKDDFARRRRVKNVVPRCDRCCAKRASGDQCTRKRRDGSMYCGTHVKGTPHGTIESPATTSGAALKQVELTAQEIKGIIYYLDADENVYKTEDVLQNKVNPAVIATYVVNPDGTYSIPDFNI